MSHETTQEAISKVKAKFTCSYVAEGPDSKTAHFYAVYSEEGENADFAKSTPGGNLSITIDKETPASDFFAQGKDYYLTFERVEQK